MPATLKEVGVLLEPTSAALCGRQTFRRRWLAPAHSAAWLPQATSLLFIVALEIGMKLGDLSSTTGSVSTVTGLLSVVLLPIEGLKLLHASNEPTSATR